jgi:peptidoglycan/LPS O-acetylase OafA/YrhL
LRGVAALAVVIGHALPMGFPQVPNVIAVGLGRVSVIAFFVLSGFVLSLPYFDGRPLPYAAFVVRRICRIYLPYAAAMLAAGVLFYTVWGQGMHLAVYEPIDGRTILHAIFMLGTMHGENLDPPTWSLVVEMRYSLLFPLLVWAAMRMPRVTIVASALMSLVLFVLPVRLSVDWYELYDPIGMRTFAGSLATTAYYASAFFGGILLAKYRDALPGIARQYGALLWGATALFAAIGAFRDPWFIVAAILIVALVPHTPAVVRAFAWQPIRWLGRVSYSLYLVHLVILVGLLRITGNPLLAALLVFPVSFVVAELFYRFIEVPSNALGKRLTRPRVEAQPG